MSGIASTCSALRHRDFRWLWAGTFCATGGQWIQQATLGWVTYEITGSAALLGAVLGMRAIPMLLLAPVSGLVADRYDRRVALAASQLLVCVSSLALALALALDALKVWHLFAFTLAAGVGAVFDRTLRSALIFNVVPRTEVANAVALNSVAFSVMRAVGPGAAGLLIASIGAAWNFGLQAMLYLAVAASALTIRTTHEPRSDRPRASAWADLKEGAQFVVSHPIARMMLVLGLIPPLLLIPSFSALMPVFAVDVFDSGPEGLGLLLSAVGVGGVAGGVLAAWLTRYDRVGFAQTGAVAAFAAALIAFAYSPSLHLAVFFLALAGMAEMVHATLHVTTLQMCAPSDMRGRIASLLPLFPAFISIGSLTSGAAAELLGPEPTVLLTAIAATAVTAGAWMRSRALREVRLSGLVAGKP
jgi:MFS transporter, DHA1 family, staphyloferrin A biosynthesis exporter